MQDSLPPGGVVRGVGGLNLNGNAYGKGHSRDKQASPRFIPRRP
jgi:hypothetical protein